MEGNVLWWNWCEVPIHHLFSWLDVLFRCWIIGVFFPRNHWWELKVDWGHTNSFIVFDRYVSLSGPVIQNVIHLLSWNSCFFEKKKSGFLFQKKQIVLIFLQSCSCCVYENLMYSWKTGWRRSLSTFLVQWRFLRMLFLQMADLWITADHENIELLQQWYSCTVLLASVSILKTFISSKNHRRKKT